MMDIHKMKKLQHECKNKTNFKFTTWCKENTKKLNQHYIEIITNRSFGQHKQI